MSVNKVLSGSRVLFDKNANVIRRTLGNQPARTYLGVTPPTVRISIKEKIALGIIMSLSCMAVPAWISYHIPDYQGTRKKD